MKLELTWPRGFRSAIWSGWGSVAGALPLPPAKFAAQLGAGGSWGALVTPVATPGSKLKRCSTGWKGAPVKSKPPSEPTPEPRLISSMSGMMARGTMDGAVGSIDGACDRLAPDAFTFCEDAAAAAAKLAMGRAPIS